MPRPRSRSVASPSRSTTTAGASSPPPPPTTQPIRGTPVEAPDHGGALAPPAPPDPSGTYSAPGLAAGDFPLRFVDPTAAHAATWFSSQPTVTTAKRVTLTSSSKAQADQA